MDAAKLAKYRAILVEMRDRLIPELSRIEQAVAEDAHPPGEISNAPTHLGNIASTNPEGNIAIAHNEQGILDQVQAAIERVDQGLYGVCEDCGKKIAGTAGCNSLHRLLHSLRSVAPNGLHVQVADFQGVLFDELAARFDFVAHQDAEHVVGGAGVAHADLDERAVGGVERRFAQFLRVHFTEAFEASHLQALFAGCADRWHQTAEIGQRVSRCRRGGRRTVVLRCRYVLAGSAT